MMQIYDRVLVSGSAATLLVLTGIVAFLLAVMGGLDVLRARLLVRAGGKLEERLGERVLDAAFKRSLASGGLAETKSLRDLETLRRFLAGNGMVGFLDAPWTPIFFLVVYLLHPLIGLVGLSGALLLVALTAVNEWLTRAPLEEANAKANRAQAFLDGSLRNVEVLQAMGMLPAFRRLWLGQRQAVISLQSSASDFAGGFLGASKTVRLLLQAAVLGTGAWLAINQQITAGTIIAGSILVARALAPIEQLIGGWKQFVAARQAHNDLRELLESLPDRPQRMKLPTPRGNLQIERLVVVPPGGKEPAIRDMNLTLPAGKALGIVGPSGAGKSSLARTIVGAWEPTKGIVRLDGAEVHSWDAAELGPHIGYLPQDVELFEGTVADNIARFGELKSEKIVEAARAADVHDMILRLPQGYNTPVGLAGARLSAGQRQRVGLARALYGHPRLVVLDEPNSNLDEAGDQALAQAIETLKSKGATVILISHRPGALRTVDYILSLNAGRVEWLGEYSPSVAPLSATQDASPENAVRVAQRQMAARAAQAQSEASRFRQERPRL